jgi:hypothetical protein
MPDNLIERIATAWLHHQGYTDAEIDAAPKSHREAGCEAEGYDWICENEHGASLHPVWDAICEAGDMANVVVEALGLTEERRVVTPQGTSRPLRDHEHEQQIGDRLRALGWWIESRHLTEWKPADGS